MAGSKAIDRGRPVDACRIPLQHSGLRLSISGNRYSDRTLRTTNSSHIRHRTSSRNVETASCRAASLARISPPTHHIALRNCERGLMVHSPLPSRSHLAPRLCSSNSPRNPNRNYQTENSSSDPKVWMKGSRLTTQATGPANC